MKYNYTAPLARIVLGASLILTWLARTATAAEDSQVLTVENKVWITPAGANERQPAKAGQVIQLHDKISTEKSSRATIRLADRSVFRINELTAFELLPPHNADRKPLLDLKTGSLYFFSREKPTDVEFRTPTAVGAIRGTEFLLSVADDGDTKLALLDGAVELSNDAGKIELQSGEQATVTKAQAPVKSPLLDAANVIQWCLYYPAVVDPDEIAFTADEQNALHDSLAAYRAGDLLGALAAMPAHQASEPGKVFQAALLSSVGRVDAAGKLLADLPASFATAQALRQLIAAVQGRDWQRTAPPATASEWLAESFYQQSRGRLDTALAAARNAFAKSPAFGFAAVRVAELEFSFARVPAAEAALNVGLKNSPRHAEGLALKGFLAAAQNQSAAALKAFDEAIAIDGALGNAWLGRGLVKIRLGQAADGRQDLQTAAALEPNRAMLRNYLSKAWSEEGREELAEKELRLARQLDPNNPTAWFYSALLKQQRNQINQAIRELEKSQELNDHQAVFRSKFLLDQDRAVRSANLANIYRDAGMEDVSVREAGKAVNADYANASAHLFLANSYELTRDPHYFNLRYEAPARSEWLIGTLLSPVGASTLSRNMSYQDYYRLFEHDGFGGSVAAEYRGNGAFSQSASQYGREGRFSYALDEALLNDPGQRANNDQKQFQISGTFKYQLTPQDEVLLFLEYFEQQSGDVAQHYSPAAANRGLRLSEAQAPNVYLGYHRAWSPNSQTLFLAGRIHDSLSLKNPDAQPLYLQYDGSGNIQRAIAEPFFNLNYHRDYEVYTAELQQIFQFNPHTFIFGGNYQNGRSTTGAELDQLGTPMSVQQIGSDVERFSTYGYYQWQIFQPLAFTAGVTYDHLRFPDNALNAPLNSREVSKDQVSPKVGLIYTPGPRTTVRAMYAQSLGGLFNENSFRLEPTEIAGLNQSFRSVMPESVVGLIPGAHIETYSASVEQSFTNGTFLALAAEWLNSDGSRSDGVFTNAFFIPSVLPNQFSTTARTFDFQERSLVFTANQLLGREWSAGARYRISQADLTGDYPGVPPSALWQASDPKRTDVNALLQQLTLSLNYNHRCGFFGQFRSQWLHQDNGGYVGGLAGNDFWQHDLMVGYRFAKRRVEIHAGVLNLADQDYHLNPLNLTAELPRNRTFVAGAKFSF
jgi:Flp pilus assembly protein TadD